MALVRSGTYYYRPGHPCASKHGMVHENDLGADRPKPLAKVPVVGDSHYDGLLATDGTRIDTRARHKEYMRQNGLTTADDFDRPGGVWDKAAQERAKVFKGEHEIKERREMLGKLAYDLEMGRIKPPEREYTNDELDGKVEDILG